MPNTGVRRPGQTHAVGFKLIAGVVCCTLDGLHTRGRYGFSTKLCSNTAATAPRMPRMHFRINLAEISYCDVADFARTCCNVLDLVFDWKV